MLNPARGDCSNEADNEICISDLRSATDVDERILKKEPDTRLYIAASSHLYAPEEIYKPNTYNHFLGIVINQTNKVKLKLSMK